MASVDLGGYELRPLPYRLEPGTPNIGGALGLAAAIDYLDSFEENMLLEHQASLSLEIENIFSSLRGVKIFGPFDGATHLPIVSLLSTVDGISADVLCRTISDSSSVMTRSGLHCAHPIFQHYRQMGGAVRISAYLYNSPAEIRLAADALERAMHPFLDANGSDPTRSASTGQMSKPQGLRKANVRGTLRIRAVYFQILLIAAPIVPSAQGEQ